VIVCINALHVMNVVNNMNNSISLNSETDSDETVTLKLIPAWFEAINMFCLIDRAGLYECPPNHRIVKK